MDRENADMSEKDVWYHGTIFGFTEFAPLAHFGTRKAALMAIIRQIVDNSANRDRKLPYNVFPVIAPTLFQIDFDPSAVPSTKQDPGSPGILGMARALDELACKTANEQYWQKYRDLRDGGHLGDDADESLYGRLDLLEEDFAAEGINAFTYPNTVEDRGNQSLVLVKASAIFPEPATETVTKSELLSVLDDTSFWSSNACYGKSFTEIFDDLYPNAT